MQDFQFRRWEILPPVVKNLLIINGLVLLAQYTIGRQLNFDDRFALHYFGSPLFNPLQLVTHMFMHGDFFHLFSNMFALWMFGSSLENVWGAKKFLIFYFACGLGAAVIHQASLYYEFNQLIGEYRNFVDHPNVNNFLIAIKKHPQLAFDERVGKFISNWQMEPGEATSYAHQAGNIFHDFVTTKMDEPTLGASGAVFGCLAAFGYLFPNSIIYINFFIPMKAKWFVLIYAAIELYSGVRNVAGDNIAHFAHLGGALVGFIMVYYWNKTNRKTFY